MLKHYWYNIYIYVVYMVNGQIKTHFPDINRQKDILEFLE